MFLLPRYGAVRRNWRRVEMKKVACTALLLLALSAGAVQAQESSAARLDVSWLTNSWVALVDLVQATFVGQTPATPPNTITLDNDCGAAIDPTGGCGH